MADIKVAFNAITLLKKLKKQELMTVLEGSEELVVALVHADDIIEGVSSKGESGPSKKGTKGNKTKSKFHKVLDRIMDSMKILTTEQVRSRCVRVTCDGGVACDECTHTD
jgi:hypothetical protein